MSINSALLKSIQVMVDKAVSNIPFDQTRQTQILSNNGDGTYVIRLDGIVYDRVPSYPKIKTLEVETIVKVKIPSNQPNQMYIIAPEDALEFLDIYYPIGSYYITDNPNFNPNVEWGGFWELVEEGRFLQATTDISKIGTKVEAGLPNITGAANVNQTYSGSPFSGGSFSGAFYAAGMSGQQYYLNGRSTGSGWSNVGFNASRSNSIYGNSTTVQPPAIKCYIWHRTMLLEIDTAYDDKGEWVDSGTRIDGHIVYQSEASYNVDDAYDIAKVTFRGYKKFELAIRSYAESTVDYVLVSTLNNDYLADMIFSQQMRAKYNDPTITKAYTRGKQSSSVYEKVLFNNLDPSQEYYFYVIYQKNSSINANDDRGYFYIIG